MFRVLLIIARRGRFVYCLFRCIWRQIVKKLQHLPAGPPCSASAFCRMAGPASRRAAAGTYGRHRRRRPAAARSGGDAGPACSPVRRGVLSGFSAHARPRAPRRGAGPAAAARKCPDAAARGLSRLCAGSAAGPLLPAALQCMGRLCPVGGAALPERLGAGADAVGGRASGSRRSPIPAACSRPRCAAARKARQACATLTRRSRSGRSWRTQRHMAAAAPSACGRSSSRFSRSGMDKTGMRLRAAFPCAA